MKQTITTRFLLLLLLSLSITQVPARMEASRKTTFTAKVDVSEHDPLKVNVFVSNPHTQKINVEVSSPEYGSVCTRSSSESNFTLCFDFSAVPDGEYTIDVVCGKEKSRKNIQINTTTHTSREARLN